ncbi:MAG: lipoate--protein ligase family protein [Candidatus Thorarchaeota archaeon]|nr:lipoate--protein ligase family protein [Candidatus Thorarchaeota archaeon]
MGQFQCLHREVNIEFCKTHTIDVARRFTGGGTVYHDLGNLNFALCLDQNEQCVPRTLRELYWNYIGYVALGLQDIGVMATYDPDRSCIRVAGKKITGTAGWIKHGVSFVHGTILVDSDLTALRESLRVPPGQTIYERQTGKVRCMDSKRDTVTSVHEQYPEGPTLEEVKEAVVQAIMRLTGREFERGEMTAEERSAAEALYRDRYSRSDWNLGVQSQDSDSGPSGDGQP